MREEELTEQLVKLMDKLDINQVGIKLKFEEELKRYNKFHRSVLGSNTKSKHKEIDLRTYAKYILKEGTNEEKRELMGCFRSKIKLIKQNIILVTN
jgi:hypothetical protein